MLEAITELLEDLFARHHDPVRAELAAINIKLTEILKMSQSATTAIADIKTVLDAEIAANTKFRADVVTALGKLSPNLSAEDQAIVDGIKAAATADTAATEAADAALTEAPAAPTA